MLSKIKLFLLCYVRSRCIFEPLKILVKPGYCSFKPWPNGVISRRDAMTRGCVWQRLVCTCGNLGSLWSSSNLLAIWSKFIPVWPSSGFWRKLVSVFFFSQIRAGECARLHWMALFCNLRPTCARLWVRLATHRKSVLKLALFIFDVWTTWAEVIFRVIMSECFFFSFFILKMISAQAVKVKRRQLLLPWVFF